MRLTHWHEGCRATRKASEFFVWRSYVDATTARCPGRQKEGEGSCHCHGSGKAIAHERLHDVHVRKSTKHFQYQYYQLGNHVAIDGPIYHVTHVWALGKCGSADAEIDFRCAQSSLVRHWYVQNELHEFIANYQCGLDWKCGLEGADGVDQYPSNGHVRIIVLHRTIQICVRMYRTCLFSQSGNEHSGIANKVIKTTLNKICFRVIVILLCKIPL
jgi:hypothetical protein